jgi:DNA/RNA endonuclease YhcR with UshA esterase domain
MYKIFVMALFSFMGTISFGQSKISVDSVNSYMGQQVIVCAEVFGVKSTESITFINLGAAYPKSPLTIVILTKDISNFKETPAQLYNNKNICVTGTLIEYKGKPEIVVTSPSEITIQ